MGQSLQDNESDPIVPISALPAKALQAVYHAVTGKVESTEKIIRKNVIVDDASIDNLYAKISQELDVLNVICSPTITIKVTYEDDSKFTYSSWERFQKVRVGEAKVTSSLELKVESVIQVPGTGIDQRLVIAVGLDSALPLLQADRKGDRNRPDMTWLAMSRHAWRTVDIKIDYVDFVIAKNFIHTIESWADSLPLTQEDESSKKILKALRYIQDIAPQFGRIGACIFLISYVIFSKSVTVSEALTAVGLSGVIWGLTEYFRRSAYRKISEAASRNIIPSVMLVSSHDQRTYDTIISERGPSARRKLANFVAWTAGSIVINVLSSYIFARYF